MHKPPTKGYVHFDRGTFERLLGGTPEPLESRFEITHGVLLSCLQGKRGAEEGDGRKWRGGGYRRLLSIIARSHGGPRQQREQRQRAAACFRTLRHAGIVNVVPYEAVRGRAVEVSGELQLDFSLHHTLSLFLVDALAGLDRESPTYALDVLTLVESICEDPDVVLRKQLDQIKTEKMAEMKAAGVEYEQRIAELETLEYPKPNRDLIYDTFNAFADRHPWVGQENVRPKSVAREMYEGFASFDDYVRSYGLERSEGVLLRYLSQVYKAMAETVPMAARSEEVMDILAHFRTLLRDVDTSLIEEWESLTQPGRARPGKAAARQAVDPAAERRALNAAVRAELHKLVRALARRDYAAAIRVLAPGTGEPWTPERFTTEMAPFWAAHAQLLTTPAARRPDRTRIDEIGPGRLRVQQTLVDADEDEDWSLDCVVDVEAAGAPPAIQLQRIGI
jgi:hypothetical protein